jgi:hypothetical protein
MKMDTVLSSLYDDSFDKEVLNMEMLMEALTVLLCPYRKPSLKAIFIIFQKL